MNDLARVVVLPNGHTIESEFAVWWRLTQRKAALMDGGIKADEAEAIVLKEAGLTPETAPGWRGTKEGD